MGRGLFQAERINRMAKLIRQHGYADINELARMFQVSKVTIRRDVEILEEKGVVVRAHGGVLAREEEPTVDLPFQTRLTQNILSKQAIGKRAAGIIRPGDIVYLDAGTTTFEIARNITAGGVTVVTHDLYIALEIATSGRAKLVVTGGMLERGVFTLTGEETAGFIRRLHVNKCFLGADAIDVSFGISNRILSEVPVKLALRGACDTLILATDFTKFHQKALYSLFRLDQVDMAVVDHADDAFIDAFARADVELLTTGGE